MCYETCRKKSILLRLLAAVFLIIATLFAAAPGARAADQDYAVVRVKLSVGTPTSLSFFVDGNYTAGDIALERQQYTVKLESGSLKLYYGPDTISSGSSIKLVRHEATDGRNNFIYLYNTSQSSYFRYLGDIEFRISSGAILVINHIYTEEYLYGVVPYEMNDKFPLEALKAQAVAARNYTVERIRRNKSKTYDLTDQSSYDQVYKGFNSSNENSIAAVDETKGRVVMSGTTVIDAFYSASNGGRTELPYHRWGGGKEWDYYQMVDDPYDLANPSSLNETITFPVSIDAEHPITTSGTSTPNASRAVEYIKKAILDSGKLSGVKNTGDFDLRGITSLHTHTYDINGSQDHSREPKNKDNNCLDKIKATGDFIVHANGKTTQVNNVTLELKYLSGAKSSTNNKYVAFSKVLGIFVIEPVYEGEEISAFSISQRRFGHGCGLSQRGAQQRAKSDDPEVNTYDKILSFYYPATTLAVKEYERPELTSVTVPDNSNAVMVWDAVNVRTGPSTDNSSIGKLPKGARIEVVEMNVGSSSWHKILYGGKYAYVAGKSGSDKYVELDDPAPPRESFTISFESNGGTEVSEWNGLRADNIPTAPETLKSGYTFGGWYRDSELKTPASFPYIALRDATLYAKWAPVSYKISYNLNGGKASNPASYTALSADIILNNPARSGYEFIGWSGTGISGLSMSVTIPAGSMGNRSYTANWKVKSAYLRAVGISAGSLSPSFSKKRYSYKIKLGEHQNSVKITPEKEYDGASMTIAGKSVLSHTATVANGKSTNVYVKVKYGRTTRTYKFTVTRAKSTNNYLSSLTAAAGGVNVPFNEPFEPGRLSYTLSLDEHTKSVKIAGAAASQYAKLSFKSKTVSLNNGQTKTVKLTVKSQAGKNRTYAIKIKRAPSTNTKLTYLKTNSSGLPLTPAYSSAETDYTVTLPVNKSSVTIYAKAAGYKAAVYIDGTKRTSRSVTLQAGQSRTVRVEVVAQSGARKVYTVNVARLISTDASLKSLKTSLKSAPLSPSFSPEITEYSITLPASSSYVTLSAVARGYGAKVKIDGKSGSSKKVTLARGGTAVVSIAVTAQDSRYTKTYVITVTRL